MGTNGKPLAAIGNFPNAIGKIMIGKTLATSERKLPMLLAIYWQSLTNWLCEALGQIGND